MTKKKKDNYEELPYIYPDGWATLSCDSRRLVGIQFLCGRTKSTFVLPVTEIEDLMEALRKSHANATKRDS